MVVREQHRVDRRQIREGNARRLTRFGPGETERACAVGEDRIDQDIAVSHLEQEATHGRSGWSAGSADEARRLVGETGWERIAAMTCAGPKLPAQQLDESLVLRLIRQVKAHAVEMVAGRPS